MEGKEGEGKGLTEQTAQMFSAVDISHGFPFIFSRTGLDRVVDFEILLALEAVEQDATHAFLEILF